MNYYYTETCNNLYHSQFVLFLTECSINNNNSAAVAAVAAAAALPAPLLRGR